MTSGSDRPPALPDHGGGPSGPFFNKAADVEIDFPVVEA
jgi:hypothetical protein